MIDYNIIIKWLNFEFKYKNVLWLWGFFNLDIFVYLICKNCGVGGKEKDRLG